MTQERHHPHTADERMTLAQEWSQLVLKVRELDNFRDFLRPPPLRTLQPAAAGGPVVVVNVSRWRCDALVVRSDGISGVPLPGLSLEDTLTWADTYLRTLQDAERRSEERDRLRERPAPTMAERQAAQRAERDLVKARAATEAMLTDLLGWMWDVIAEPVLKALQLPETAELPRIWWCPTGPLTLLPLHAAGRHGERRSVMDRVVSSYTPTLRALLEARTPVDPARAGAERLLVVGLMETEGQRTLPGVAEELAFLTALIPGERRTDLLGSRASCDAVRVAMRTHRWAHLSCHGHQELDDPSRGGLILHDGVLTAADLAAEQYQAEFAWLSACKTATGGVNLLDEAITLAAAMHYTGYRHVIANLWSVYDSGATTGLSAAVYREIAVDGRLRPERSARALHRAVVRLRDEAVDQPSVWTPFTHTGP
ncbi:CHAT domain-containing protein [Streptomyces sp. NPDC002928]|uniref:CHAT domain-containing protein n=1 Tax=Streptomyces sp. NPDC002928 TaxID=3154440 RepID=UPI0033B3F468